MVDPVTPLEEEQATLLLNMAHSLAREKRYQEAKERYREFLALHPKSTRRHEARSNLARIYEKEQRYDKAIAQYLALYRELGITPLGLLYYLEAARLSEMSGDDEAALRIYREIHAIDPNSEAAARARVRLEALQLADAQLEKSSPQKE
ncbi:MAG: tetratricopeptide repeat protein [Turneriella sp.]|nr:tetratricopeptide repeat protein [Turneriella sp.]